MVETVIGLTLINSTLAVLLLLELKKVKEIQEMAKFDVSRLQAAAASLITVVGDVRTLAGNIGGDYATLKAKIQELIDQGQFDPTTVAALNDVTTSIEGAVAGLGASATKLSDIEKTVDPAALPPDPVPVPPDPNAPPA